jgi:hypothetical protein
MCAEGGGALGVPAAKSTTRELKQDEGFIAKHIDNNVVYQIKKISSEKCSRKN